MEENNNKHSIIILLLIICIVALIIGGTYAYFTIVKTSNEKKISTGGIEVTYVEDNTVISVDNSTTILDSEYETKASSLEFSVTNSGSLPAFATIKLNVTYTSGGEGDTTNENAAKSSDYKWALTRDGVKVSTGTFSDADTYIIASNLETINNGITANYKLYVWASETWEEQSELKQSGVSINIEVENSGNVTNYLNSTVLGTNYDNVNQNEYNISNDFTCSDGVCVKNYTDGIYISTNTDIGYPTYYYRGNIENNYVLFANILWRIVRINEDQSIRLISNDSIDSNISYSNNESSIQTYYDTNLATYDDMIATEGYCTDKYGNSNQRITNNNPQFSCELSEKTYKKNGSLSLDELAFSGGYNNSLYSSSVSYLNNGTIFYTSTEGSILNSTTNLIDINQTITTASSRIVINLKSDSIIYDGKGSEASPWIIQ